jgi:hypothetical protein
MADSVVTPGQHSVTAVHQERPISTLRFDLAMGLLSMVFVSGVYLDGWAHAHGLVDRTFFTPWHAVLYTGYLVNALVLVITLVLNHAHGSAWKHAMPAGYEVSLLGVPLFALAGIGDLGWHTLFGFEVNLETVLSPTHLLLAFSGILIMGGPFRAALRRPTIPVQGSFTSRLVQGWKTLCPVLLSLTALLSVFTFFTQFAHPFVLTEAVITIYTVEQALLIASILLQTGLLMGMSFLLIRRWRLPLGALTLIFTLNGALMSVLADQYRLIPTMLLAGIVADLLLWLLKPQASRPVALRLFAFVVPLVLYLCYFLTLMVGYGMFTDVVIFNWPPDLWLGASVMAGMASLVLSYLLAPPEGEASKAV